MAEKNSNSQVWNLKYFPKKLSDIEGQERPLTQLRKFVDSYKLQKKKSVLVYGPPGCGKTAAVYALANEMQLEVFELNASDFRNKDAIENILGSAVKQMSLFSRGKLILVDEVDGISGTKDRGGLVSIVKLLKESTFPVILLANDPFDKKFSALRKAAVMVEFDELSTSSVFNVLKKIAEAEGVDYDEIALKSISRRSGGDLRAAVNDLQLIAMMQKSVKQEDLEVLSDREKKEEMSTALTRVFKTTDPKLAIGAFDNVPEDLHKCAMWVDESLPKEYDKPADLCRAYNFLSKADVFDRRIRRWQHWRFLVYINAFLTAGVAVSKDEKYKKMIDYKQSTIPLKIYMANMRHAKRKAIAEKIAAKTHVSMKLSIKTTLPYVKTMIKNDANMADSLAEYFEFDPDEVTWLKR